MTPFPKHPPSPRELGELAQLLFEWPIRRAPRLTLPFCILVAAVIQAAVIFLFSIHYSTAVERFSQPPSFYFLPPDSAIARRIAPWLEAHDPSVFSPLRATEMAVPPPPPLKYHPSYEDPPPPLKALPEETGVMAVPPPLPYNGEELRVPGNAPTLRVAPPVRRSGDSSSAVRWLDGLAGRSLTGDTDSSLPPVPAKVATPSVYEVAVGRDGIPLSCVLTEASGDEATDASGRRWIISRRFTSSDALTWGRVFLDWNGIPAPAESPKTP